MKNKEANIPIFWKKGDALRQWAKERTFEPKKEGADRPPGRVPLGDVAEALYEAQVGDDETV